MLGASIESATPDATLKSIIMARVDRERSAAIDYLHSFPGDASKADHSPHLEIMREWLLDISRRHVAERGPLHLLRTAHESQVFTQIRLTMGKQEGTVPTPHTSWPSLAATNKHPCRRPRRPSCLVQSSGITMLGITTWFTLSGTMTHHTCQYLPPSTTDCRHASNMQPFALSEPRSWQVKCRGHLPLSRRRRISGIPPPWPPMPLSSKKQPH